MFQTKKKKEKAAIQEHKTLKNNKKEPISTQKYV